jgi:enoyl-CoA hydratase
MANPNDADILLIDTQDRVRTLTLNRPQSRNALSAELRGRFFTALRDAEADDDVDVVIALNFRTLRT